MDQIKYFAKCRFCSAEIGDEIHFIIEFDNFQDYRVNKNLRLCILYGTRLDENLHKILKPQIVGTYILLILRKCGRKSMVAVLNQLNFLSAHVSISLVSRKTPEPVVPIFLLDDFGIEFQETK